MTQAIEYADTNGCRARRDKGPIYQRSATGYGSKLNSGLWVEYAGRWRRIWCICYSNAGSAYIIVSDKKLFLDDTAKDGFAWVD